MADSEHIEDFKAKLNDLISSFKQFYGSLKTLKGDNVNKTLIKQGDDHWENLHSRMEKMKVAYDTFSNQTAENVDKYVKEINSIEEEDRKDNSVLKNALLEMKTSKVNNSVIQIYEECIAKREERLNRMKNTNEEFSNNINEITEDFANKLERIEKDHTSEVNEMLKNFNENIEIMIDKNEVLKKASLMNNKDPVFIYNGNKISKIDVELVKKYPGSYFYKEYMDNHITADGNIYIDIDGENDDFIIKYMKDDDDSLIEDVKKMNIEKKNKLINDLNFLELPIKKDIINELGCNEDNEMMEAWRDRSVVMVNGQKNSEFTKLLQSKNLMNSLLSNKFTKYIQYNKETKEMIIDMKMKYYDVIEDYLKNGKVNRELVKNHKCDGNEDELMNEMEMIGIELSDEGKKDIISCFYNPLIMNSSKILDTIEYEKYLQKWAGNYNWRLIYRASEHGYTAKSFHECCDDVNGPTLVIIKSSEGWIFGGYTTKSWSGYGIYDDMI